MPKPVAFGLFGLFGLGLVVALGATRRKARKQT